MLKDGDAFQHRGGVVLVQGVALRLGGAIELCLQLTTLASVRELELRQLAREGGVLKGTASSIGSRRRHEHDRSSSYSIDGPPVKCRSKPCTAQAAVEAVDDSVRGLWLIVQWCRVQTTCLGTCLCC